MKGLVHPTHRPLPSGRLAFFFTDIEGSTSRWERFPDAMRTALAVHDRIVRDAIEGNGGTVFKTVGDAFCAVFATATAAIVASLDVQRDLARAAFEAVDGLAARIAIHVGRAEERDGDYFGATVNRVARVLAVAHGGQIVVTQAVVDDTRDDPSLACTFADLGDHRLRDLKQPERIAQVVANGVRREFPDLRSLGTYTNNLPLALTELIGRRVEIDEIRTMLDGNRLVTVTGTGGVGKTRVALAVAAELVDRYRDGVWFVDLSPLPNATYVVSAFGVAIGLGGKAENVESLVAHLRFKRTLLVVDNCEHVADIVANLASELLRSCDGVTILATSRERLVIDGERPYPLPSLAVPPPDSAIDLMRYDAYAFFIDRAIAAFSGNAISDDDRLLVGTICRRLDGIPFALELAAARTRVLTPKQIVERLDERLHLLSSANREKPARQQTIRALIDWTYDSLSNDERVLFERLATFAGGWTLDAAEAVCADGTLARHCILDVLGSLVDKSLVHPDLSTDRMRFGMHETTRAYALEKLVARDERRAMAAALARWIATLLETNDPAGATGTGSHAFSELAAENDNIRVALAWALDPDGDRHLAARIAASAARTWYDAGLATEGIAWIESLLPLVDDVRDPNRAAALWMGLARLTVARRSIEAATRALAIYERVDDSVGIASALVRLTFNYYQTREMDLARETIDRALALLQTIGRAESVAYAGALDVRGGLFLHLGRHGEARSSMEEALRLFLLAGEELGAARVRGNLAELAFARGDHAEALRYVDDAAATFHRLRSTSRECMSLVNAASYRLAVGDVDIAESSAHIAIRMANRIGDAQLSMTAIQHVACVEAARERYVEAAVLLGYVDAWFMSEGYEREWNEAGLRAGVAARLERHLDGSSAASAAAFGARLTFAEANERALASKSARRTRTA